MRILMLNGSPRPNGNTFLALSEIGKQLKEEGMLERQGSPRSGVWVVRAPRL